MSVFETNEIIMKGKCNLRLSEIFTMTYYAYRKTQVSHYLNHFNGDPNYTKSNNQTRDLQAAITRYNAIENFNAGRYISDVNMLLSHCVELSFVQWLCKDVLKFKKLHELTCKIQVDKERGNILYYLYSNRELVLSIRLHVKKAHHESFCNINYKL